jgi:hypothetical protein
MRSVLFLIGLVTFATETIFAVSPNAADNTSFERLAASRQQTEIIEQFSGKLNDLERRLFADAADGQLDDFSLLDAALIGSGEDSEVMLRHYENRLAGLLDELRSSIDPKQLPEKNAERVFEFMHQRVLHGGYRLECTDIRMAFDEGRYNCVSASVLFNCLASGVGLNCCGLEAPGHAMSRIYLPEGRLDLETTSPHWFQRRDDPTRFREDVVPTEPSKSSALSMPYATQQEHCLPSSAISNPAIKREVTPVQMTAMVYYNRGVDFLAEKRFADAATVNAKALWLDPQNTTARGNFLATLNNWSIGWCSSLHYAAAAKLLRTGMIFDRQYPAFQQNFVYLHHQWSEQLCREGHYSEAVDLLRKAAEELPEKDYLKQSLWDVYRRWMRSKQEE